jgi:hypothetical protein
MITPVLPAWVEQRNDFTRLGIGRSHVASLEAVALRASIRKIIGSGSAAVLSGNHVIHFVRKHGVVCVEQAILAAYPGTYHHQVTQTRGDVRHVVLLAANRP